MPPPPPPNKKPKLPTPYPPPQNTRQITFDNTLKPPLSYVNKVLKTFAIVYPPPTNTPTSARLCTVGISHYAEKVRWGFDISSTNENFSYCEDAHPPGLAALYTTRMDKSSSATPIVEYRVNDDGGDNIVIKDSTEILEKLCPFLYPPEYKDEILKLEQKFDDLLGPQARVYAYEHVLDPKEKELLISLGSEQTSFIEGKVFVSIIY